MGTFSAVPRLGMRRDSVGPPPAFFSRGDETERRRVQAGGRLAFLKPQRSHSPELRIDTPAWVAKHSLPHVAPSHPHTGA